MHGEPKLSEGFKSFSYANSEAPKGGKLVLGVVGSFDSLNPFIVRGTVPQAPAFSLFSSASVYESLMARSWDEPFTLYGLIAQTVQVPQDRSFIIFNLNSKAHWSDGQPITADDVLYSYQTLREKGRPNHRTYYKKVAKAEKLDARRIRFDFVKQADGSWDREMPLIMGLMPVLAKHDWEKRRFDETTLTPPISSGPYIITNVDAGRTVTLTRNKAYWGNDVPAQQGLFNFDEVRIDFYRDDNVALQAFKAGAFDLRREPDPQKWAKAYDGPARMDGSLSLTPFEHKRTEPVRGFVLNTRRPLLSDPTLRQALNLAFDFEWINRSLFDNAYKRTNSYFPNSELAANPSPWQESPVRDRLLQAARILKEKGYQLKGTTLHNQTDIPVTFEIMLSDPTEEKIALSWVRNLERLGIKANIRTTDSAQYQERLNGFDYDVTVARWSNSLSPGNEQMFFWSCAAAKQNGSRNYAGICDPKIDKLAAAIPAAPTREDLVQTTRAMDQVLMNGNYIVPFYYLGADLIAYFQTRLNHPKATPLYGPIIESWWSHN